MSTPAPTTPAKTAVPAKKLSSSAKSFVFKKKFNPNAVSFVPNFGPKKTVAPAPVEVPAPVVESTPKPVLAAAEPAVLLQAPVKAEAELPPNHEAQPNGKTYTLAWLLEQKEHNLTMLTGLAEKRITYPEITPGYKAPNRKNWPNGKNKSQNPNSGFGPRSPGGKKNRRNNHKGRYPKKDAPMDIEIKALEKSENRYIVLTKADLETNQIVLRSFRSILNKMTPEMFDALIERCVEQAKEIKSPELLKSVANAGFEKALAEPNFSPCYADLFVKLIDILPTFDDKPELNSETKEMETTVVNFKKVIKSLCEQEFQSQVAYMVDSKKVDLEALSESDLWEHEAAVKKAKKRYLGCIRLMGELFIKNIIKLKLLRLCMGKLLEDVDSPVEENVEALCKLIETVGSVIEKSERESTKEFLDERFAALNVILDARKVGPRTRFMIQDINDLRANKWVARIKKATQKKVSEIHAESAEELRRDAERQRQKDERRQQVDNMRGRSRYQKGGSQDVRGPRRRGRQTQSSESGWSTIGNEPPKSGNGWLQRRKAAQAAKEKAAKSKSPAKVVKKLKKKKEVLKPSGGNKFAGLLSDSEEEEEEEVVVVPEEPAVEEGAEAAAEPEVAEEKIPVQDREDIIKSIRTIVKDILNADKLEESLEEVAEKIKLFGTAQYNDDLVLEAVVLAAERNKIAGIDRFNSWFDALFEAKFVSKDTFEKAWGEIIINADSFVIDIPLFFNFCGPMLAYAIHKDFVGLNFLGSKVVQGLKKSLPKLVVAVVKKLAEYKTEATLVEEIAACESLDLATVLGEGVVAKDVFTEAGLTVIAETL